MPLLACLQCKKLKLHLRDYDEIRIDIIIQSCEGCYILDTEAPKCYTDAMFTRAMMIYNAFAVYDNVIVRILKAAYKI